jgi:hypothetical protein
MTKTGSLLVLTAVLAACAESATAPAMPDVAPAFAATTTTSSTVIAFALDAFVSCAAGGAGETVSLTGRLHVLLHTTVTADGTVHAKTHFQPQAFGGTGQTTGDKYRGVGVTQDILTVHPGGFPVTFSFINNFRIIGQGRGNNFQVHENTHVTINANGDVTVDHTNAKVTCT